MCVVDSIDTFFISIYIIEEVPELFTRWLLLLSISISMLLHIYIFEVSILFVELEPLKLFNFLQGYYSH